jgi:hypothetical protein
MTACGGLPFAGEKQPLKKGPLPLSNLVLPDESIDLEQNFTRRRRQKRNLALLRSSPDPLSCFRLQRINDPHQRELAGIVETNAGLSEHARTAELVRFFLELLQRGPRSGRTALVKRVRGSAAHGPCDGIIAAIFTRIYAAANRGLTS